MKTDTRQRAAACLLVLFVFALAGLGSRAHADMQVLITKGVSDPVPVAIVPFALAGAPTDLAAIVDHDLASSGRFRTMARTQMPGTPGSAADVHVEQWRAGADFVLVGQGSGASVQCELLNTRTGERLGSASFTGADRMTAHHISDFVYEKILGVPGAFASRIAYVAVRGPFNARRFALIVADADGQSPKTVMESSQPILSPAWSPDQQWLAYVSFENRVSAVYLQRLKTGERILVSARAGVNSAPAFSPDGRRLALTLSGSGGNLDIWLLDLATQKLERLTYDPAVDTEAVWADAHTLYFTSDRAGGPQIYRLDVAQPGHAERVTFGSAYNARPRIAPDGKRLAFVTREGRAYRIAVQDLASGTVTVLSHGALDESPSFAPNGANIIYASREADGGGLQVVSVDGQVTQRLQSDQGEVREPAWAGTTNP